MRRTILRKWLRRLGLGMGALVLLLAMAAGGSVVWLHGSLPERDGIVTLQGLRAPVEILRDANAVPHIFAESEADAYFALGFAHAQDRLWQMETMRRFGQGRLAEVVGPPGLDTDRFMRTLGLYRVAETMVERLPPDLRTGMEAYAAGVNAYLETRSGPLPPEFVLLRHTPEPWRPADSLVWSRLMALQLSVNWRRELNRARFATRLPPERVEELWPDDPPGATVSVHAAAALPGEAWAALADAMPPAIDGFSASNAWTVGGERTASGLPILANDPHLGFAAPGTWYLARIVTPAFTVTGATAPGVPLTILGHNGFAAWGMTSTGGDVQDLVVERIGRDSDRYLTPDGPRPFALRDEVIAVKGAEPVRFTVRETRNGPIVSDLIDDAARLFGPDTAVAFRTTMLNPDDRAPEGVYRLNRMRGWDDFAAAARLFHAPQQHVFYADAAGDHGMILAGAIPIRRSGDGRVPVPGADGAHDWTGFVPPDENPESRNPDTGFVVNANNRTVNDAYPYALGGDWDPSFRADRIVELLNRNDRHSADDSLAIQLDILSPAARELVPLLLSLTPRTDERAAALDLLRNWDFTMRRDRPEPLVFAAWLLAAVEALASDALGDLFSNFQGLEARFVAAALTENRHWCGTAAAPGIDPCAERLGVALDRTLAGLAAQHGEDLATWRWGAVHRATFRHLVLSHVPLLGPWLAQPVIATDGGDFTINRGQTRGRAPNPFSHVHGAGYRAVYDLADLDSSRLMIATGQSGNPLSRHYADLLETWRDGGFITVAGDRETLRREGYGTLILMPAAER